LYVLKSPMILCGGITQRVLGNYSTMSDNLSLRRPSILLATWFGSGLAPVAPGTVGSLAALPFIIAAVYFGGDIGLVAFTILAFVVGLWAAADYVKRSGDDDPSPVVIDEVAGQAITFLPFVHILSWQMVLAGFVLFRIFDALKPWPINWLDRTVKGGLGVMLDDVVAGIAAGVCLYVWTIYLPNWLGL
jgi:phosphatidylglycerophosphatase A